MGQHTYTPRMDVTQPVSQNMSEIRQALRNRPPVEVAPEQTAKKSKLGWSLKKSKNSEPKKAKLKTEKPKAVKFKAETLKLSLIHI